MTTSIQDLIKQKQQDLAAKKGRSKTWKPGQGKSKVRILPSWRGNSDPQFFHDFGQHYVKNSKGETDAVYLCVEKTFGHECPVCQAIGHGIKNSNDDDVTKLLKQANASQKFLMNVLVLSDPDESKRLEPQIMEVGITVFESICTIIGEYGDITQLDDGGVDLIITREGKTQFDTKYTVMPSPKSIKVPAKVMESIHNLDEYVAQENEAAQNKAIAAVGRAAGLLTADTASAALAAPKSKSKSEEMSSVMAEDAEYEDLPWAPEAEVEDASIAATPAASAPADIGDDDLDSLLAELG